MAIIGNIRNRLGLLTTIIIGLALLSFILGDLFSGKYSSKSGEQVTNIAEISGEPISYSEFNDKFQTIRAQSQGEQVNDDQLREEIYDIMVKEKILQKEYQHLGLIVSQDEYADMFLGTNIHPSVTQSFTDPKTGMFHKEQVQSFLKKVQDGELPEEDLDRYLRFEEEIIKERKNQKYNTLISKGLFITTTEAKRAHEEQQKEVKFQYIVKRYIEIPDSTIEATEAELKAFYEKHKSQSYKKDQPTRKIEYVVFDVLPSAQDSENVRMHSSELVEEFKSTKEDSLFVSLKSEMPYEDVFKTRETIPSNLDSVFAKAAVGTVYGPYQEHGSYKLAKLVGKAIRPDSVQARHILIRPINGDYKAAQTRIDSIKGAIQAGAPFSAMAARFSQDGSKDKGGDLGTFVEGQMVKPFNEACFTGKKGELQVVTSQFGVHLIEILKTTTPKEKFKIGIIEHKIAPSSITRKEVHAKALKFIAEAPNGEGFEKAVSEQGLNKRSFDAKKGDREIKGLESPRELIRWAWEEKSSVGDVIPKPFEFGNKMVVAHLAAIYDDGFVPLDEVRNDVESKVKKEKKAEKLMADLKNEIGSATTLQEVAGKLNLVVDTVEHVRFTSKQLQGLGRELDLIGAVFALPQGKLSAPIKGENGVYVLVVDEVSVVPPPPSDDYKPVQKNLSNQLQGRVANQAYDALEKNAKIVDNRASFY